MNAQSHLVYRLCAGGVALAWLLLSQVAARASQPPPGHSPMPPTAALRHEVWQLVMAELRQKGLPETQLPQPDDLDLPGTLPPLKQRDLKVSLTCWDENARRTQFRIECSAAGQCLPFLVYLHDGYLRDGGIHPRASRDDASEGVTSRAGSCQPSLVRVPLPKSGVGAPPATRPAIGAGDRATAVFVGGHLRMTSNVICLERGRQGDVIRVRGPDGHVFRARISGPALLDALP